MHRGQITGKDNQEKRVRLKRLWAPVFIMVGISILSGSAGIQTKGWFFVGMDKVAHLLVFGMLGIAWIRCFNDQSVSRGTRLVYAILFTTAFGMIDELHQYHNPLRTFEWADLLADFTGSVLASGIYLSFAPIRGLLETEIGQYLRLPFIKKNPDSTS